MKDTLTEKVIINILRKKILRRGHRITPEVIAENGLENPANDVSEHGLFAETKRHNEQLSRHRKNKSIQRELDREKNNCCPNRFHPKNTRYNPNNNLENFSIELGNPFKCDYLISYTR